MIVSKLKSYVLLKSTQAESRNQKLLSLSVTSQVILLKKLNLRNNIPNHISAVVIDKYLYIVISFLLACFIVLKHMSCSVTMSRLSGCFKSR